jgi:hypothetical protein
MQYFLYFNPSKCVIIIIIHHYSAYSSSCYCFFSMNFALLRDFSQNILSLRRGLPNFFFQRFLGYLEYKNTI